MSAQATLPSCATAPTVNLDLRGDTALAILSYLAWSDAHCDARKMLDGSIAAWLTAGKPEDPQIARSLVKLRGQLARYVDHGGAVPSWFPQSLLKAIEESSTDMQSAGIANAPPAENTSTTMGQRSHSVAKVPQDQPTRKE